VEVRRWLTGLPWISTLRNAAEGVTDTLDKMATRMVSDIDAAKEAFGHDGLAAAVEDFCDRWEIGVEHLTKDAAEVVGRLNWSVTQYQQIEGSVQRSMDGILQRLDQPDPAVQ
jgi:hypothetical protein